MAAAKNKQVAALCWRRKRGQLQVLLITSRETRRWVIPKGWPMDGLMDFNAARTEAKEEAGAEGRMTRKPIGRYTYMKRDGAETQSVSVTVFGLEVETLAKDWKERKERKREWFDAEDAAIRVHEDGLKALIRAFDDK